MAAHVNAAIAREGDAIRAQQRPLHLGMAAGPGTARLTAMIDDAVRREVVRAAGQRVADQARVAWPAQRQGQIAVGGNAAGPRATSA
jgi:hypothetical protein